MADHSEATSRDTSEGFTLLDGAALVIGAAVGSVHLRGLPGEAMRQSGPVLFWLTFAGVALTASGPFLFLARRFGRRPPGYPRLGDRTWGILGLPWALTAWLRVLPWVRGHEGFILYVEALGVGLVAASMMNLAVVWRGWVLAAPKAAGEEPLNWTARIGLVLSVAWPIQWGFGLVVTSGVVP